MNIELQHPFWPRYCYDYNKLLKNVTTLDQFRANLNKQSAEHPDYFSPNNYKGAAFEALIEAIINLHPVDKRIDCPRYVPIQFHPAANSADEYGVDGVGSTGEGGLHLVQVKYKTNPKSWLNDTNDNISRFPAALGGGNWDDYIIPNKKTAMTIWTSGQGVVYSIKNNMPNVRIFNYWAIRQLIDNNFIFWSTITNLVKNSFPSKNKDDRHSSSILDNARQFMNSEKSES